jgi:hypothetical protein
LLRQFLLGESRESDGVPKEAKWMYKLHMRLGNYDRAGKSAAIIADELLSKAGTGQGYYTQSRDVLRDAQMDLAANGRPPPTEVSSRLRLLHSYNIVRGLMAREEHVNAARMLVNFPNSPRPPSAIQLFTRTSLSGSLLQRGKQNFRARQPSLPDLLLDCAAMQNGEDAGTELPLRVFLYWLTRATEFSAFMGDSALAAA